MTRHFCTYFDHNYLPRGMVMLESLHEHCPEAHVHVLCLSDECHGALAALAYPFVSLIRLDELEAADPALAATRPTRSLIEYYFTITPCLPWHLLTRRGLEEITYLDADMMFFSSPEPIFKEAGAASVIITPHRFSEKLSYKKFHGLYNVSWLTFRNTGHGLDCLAWYKDACLDWCYDVLEETRYADQKYLDIFPEKFLGVHVMRNSGGGVAPWNLADSIMEIRDGCIVINNDPLIFYHAHNFMHIYGPFFSSGLLEYTPLTTTIREYIFLRYIKNYVQATKKIKKPGKIRSFFSVRVRRKQYGTPFGVMKAILREWKHGTLVVTCLPGSNPAASSTGMPAA